LHIDIDQYQRSAYTPALMRAEKNIEIDESGLGQDAAAVARVEQRVSVDPAEGRIRSGKLAGLSMNAAIWVIAWPVLIESLLQSLVGMVDTTLAAGVSEAAADAIGGTSYFIWIIQIIGSALAVGATALVSRAVGKGRTALAGAVVGQCVLGSLAAGVVMAAIVFALAPFVAVSLNLSPEASAAATTYLRIVAFGVPCQILLAAGTACCRGAGDSLSAMLIMVSVNIVNTVVSFLLSGVEIAVSKLDAAGQVQRTVLIPQPMHLDMGVRGIAIGTLAAWIVGAMMILALLARGTHGLKLRTRRLRPHWHTMRRLIRLGVPNALSMFAMWFGNWLALLLVGLMKTPGFLGAHIVAVRIESFSFMPGLAMGTAAATLAGQYLGAGQPPLARCAVLKCTLITAVFMALGGIIMAVFAKPIVGLFSQQPTHLALTPLLLIVTGIIQAPFGAAIVLRSGMLGAGDTKASMYITWFCIFGLRLPLAWLCCGVDLPLPGGGTLHNPAPLQEWFGLHPLAGFWVGLCLEIMVRLAIFFARFLHGGWLRLRV
jgi:putative MATE family efflux protein